jgi:hypothetical protein
LTLPNRDISKTVPDQYLGTHRQDAQAADACSASNRDLPQLDKAEKSSTQDGKNVTSHHEKIVC